MAIAAHSTCQPGRPGPNEEAQDGSPGRAASQTRASSGSFFPGRAGSPPRSAKSIGHRRRVEPRHRAELGIGRPREVEITLQVVERPALGQPPGELLDDRQRLHGADQAGRRQHPQRLHIAPVACDLPVGEVTPVFGVTGRPLQQGVVHVCDVLHVNHVVPGVVPGPDQQIPGEEGGRVADVRRVVGGDAARVHGRGRAGRRLHQLTGRGVADVRFRAPSRQGGNADRAPGIHQYCAAATAVLRRWNPRSLPSGCPARNVRGRP